MSLRKRFLMALLAAFLFSSVASPAWAQDAEEKKEETSKEEKSSDEEKSDEEKDEEESDEESDEEEDEKEEDEEDRESEHGEYEFKRSYGGGVEFGLFFSPFERWNAILLEPNGEPEFDTDVALNLDLAFEVTPLEGARFAIFGGMQGTGTNNPGLSALYFGLEPAFAFRRERWELAVGTAIGFGRLDLSLDSGNSARTGLILARPFIEARTYAAKFAAIYARLGFNYWHVYNEELSGLQPTENRPGNVAGATTNLNEGGIYLSIGTRFGHYPEPVKSIPDSDEDGLRDDVDDCPDEPEDKDEFQDEDGCPEPDNDEDTILDEADQCPLDKEDLDKFEDEDGCPDPDNDKDNILDVDDDCPDEAGIPEKNGCPLRDKDGDGIYDDDDKCPTEAEDKDGFEDEDGCPDPDNDKDGFLDADDKCPNEAETYNGNEDEDGCPDGDMVVVVTETEIKINEKVFFESGKAAIQEKSFKLLDTVAVVLNRNAQITKIRIEGHTDDVGRDESNLKLSKERAASVRKYLEEKGVDAARLESEGFGETQPLCEDVPKFLEKKGNMAKAKLDACRLLNRRVQFKITEVNGKPVDAAEAVTIEEKKVVEEPIKKDEEKKEEAPK
jgi:outer membrane protein OmpA-like peptidoglycan-associated protein